MSKEELQVNFRMPASLKRDLEAAAKSNGRSLTSEVVMRLEVSVALDTPSPDRFLSADRALALAEYARKDVATNVQERVQRFILAAANAGVTETLVRLDDYNLAELPSEKLEFLKRLVKALEEQGYKVALDELSSIRIDFSNPPD
ncbi:Arc-like DNA binding domain-containing protein [Pseudomonas synxantha]|uniref:Arc-like DNA binding domain-containing protein n=1 Tax=Pseudomonas synxantha TaxID=47883 RepID=A0AAX3I525_9PSED|nr:MULTISPECIES: Arc family DNA-binding protein [Pseudomonas fluorescens group]NMZ09589.1 Arc family DNA-binding protein [Pseudomonas proteolytica]SDU19621.1 Arc-like DNA binding domain-containing protein [Pseudomonas synxantha]VTQ97805.1 Arc-like DNA binding domain-containing protein [Pseudomonas synxantha]